MPLSVATWNICGSSALKLKWLLSGCGQDFDVIHLTDHLHDSDDVREIITQADRWGYQAYCEAARDSGDARTRAVSGPQATPTAGVAVLISRRLFDAATAIAPVRPADVPGGESLAGMFLRLDILFPVGSHDHPTGGWISCTALALGDSGVGPGSDRLWAEGDAALVRLAAGGRPLLSRTRATRVVVGCDLGTGLESSRDRVSPAAAPHHDTRRAAAGRWVAAAGLTRVTSAVEVTHSGRAETAPATAGPVTQFVLFGAALEATSAHVSPCGALLTRVPDLSGPRGATVKRWTPHSDHGVVHVTLQPLPPPQGVGELTVGWGGGGLIDASEADSLASQVIRKTGLVDAVAAALGVTPKTVSAPVGAAVADLMGRLLRGSGESNDPAADADGAACANGGQSPGVDSPCASHMARGTLANGREHELDHLAGWVTRTTYRAGHEARGASGRGTARGLRFG